MSSDYARSDMVDALRAVGIEEKDTIFVHSNIGLFGQLDSAETKSEYCESIYSAVRETLGEDGTLVVPTFTYSFTEGDQYDPSSTDTDMGLFAEYVRTHPDSVRSIDPNFSVTAIGPRAEQLTDDPPTHSFGDGSFWERFLAIEGKFCNFNFGADSTFLHYVERCLDVPYRWDKPFAGTIIRGDTRERRVFYHYVRALEIDAHAPDMSDFQDQVRREDVLEQTSLGRGRIVSITAQDMYNVAEQGYVEDRSFLIKGPV